MPLVSSFLSLVHPLSAAWTAPTAMPLYTPIVLWFAREGRREYVPSERPWYAGEIPASFADMPATLKVRSVEGMVLRTCGPEVLASKPVRSLVHCLKLAA